jgi:hypothetical protein
MYTSEIFPPVAPQPYSGLGRLVVEFARSHTIRHTTLGGTPLDKGSVRRREYFGTCILNYQEWSFENTRRSPKFPLLI